jgi:hypothetical protein
LRLQSGESLCERPVDLPELRRREKNEGCQKGHNDRDEIRLKRGEDSLDLLAHGLTDRLFNNCDCGRADGLSLSDAEELGALASLSDRADALH